MQTLNDKKTGVLLISLGTPDSTAPKDVRRFLAEFLSDRHVVSLNRLIWLPILYGPVLTFRPKKTAKAYEKIWNVERDESPLRTISREQSQQMKKRFEADDILVDWAFRYGTPSLEDKITSMMAAGCERIIFFALYPQYSDTTTGSTYDRVDEIVAKLRQKPDVVTVERYNQNPVYIDSVVQSVEAELAQLDFEPDALLASYHSIPQPYSDAGDPYKAQVEESDTLLHKAFGARSDMLHLSYQSRFGFQEWLRPYSDDKIRELAEKGIKKLVVFAPGFSSDCLESLEEIDMQFREIFMEAGGTHFHYVPCLNASELGINVFEDVIRGHL